MADVTASRPQWTSLEGRVPNAICNSIRNAAGRRCRDNNELK